MRLFEISKIYLLGISFIYLFHFHGFTQLQCTDFTVTGTSTSPYFLSGNPGCAASPFPIGQLIWTQSPVNGFPNGFIKHTFNDPQTNVSIWYTVVNDNDVGTITVNGGGVLSLNLDNGCADLLGNVVGPYTGGGLFGDILVNIQSSLPFTEVTLVNTGGQSGHVSGDCSSVIINENDPCSTDLGNDTTLCQGETLILDATASNATYLWQDNSTNPQFNVVEQGTYWVQVTENNCISGDTIEVNFNPLPIINLGDDTTLCQGETLTLDVTSSNTTYLWQDNSTGSVFTVIQQGVYWAQVSSNNCTAEDTIQVNYNPLPLFDLGTDTTLCQGEILILDATTENATYLWQDNSINSTYNVIEEGVYSTQVSVNNCNSEDTIIVSYTPLPTIEFGPDTTLCQGETLTLDATNSNASYLWQDNSTNPTFNIVQEGTYWAWVTATDCSASDTILVSEIDCEITLQMPNVFSPNNDDVNDLFVPIYSNGIVSMNTLIFNRWGNLVYETDRLLIEWNGEGFNDGTYFWVVHYIDINGEEKDLTGYVTLMK